TLSDRIPGRPGTRPGFGDLTRGPPILVYTVRPPGYYTSGVSIHFPEVCHEENRNLVGRYHHWPYPRVGHIPSGEPAGGQGGRQKTKVGVQGGGILRNASRKGQRIREVGQ